MRWSDINRNPTPRTLRQFAVIWMVFFLCLAGGQGEAPRGFSTAGFLAVSVGLLGLVRPTWIRWIFVGSMMLTFPIGWTVSQLMLALLYFGIFTPLAVLFRIMGRDQLLRTRRPRESLWLEKPPPADVRSYFRQS